MRTEIRLSIASLGMDLFALLLEYAEAREQSPVSTTAAFLEVHKLTLKADYEAFLNEKAERMGITAYDLRSQIQARLFQSENGSTTEEK